MFQIASFKIIWSDSIEILFSKLRSAGLNHHLPKHKFFTFSYCAGVSNKHCLLTFFLISNFRVVGYVVFFIFIQILKDAAFSFP